MLTSYKQNPFLSHCLCLSKPGKGLEESFLWTFWREGGCFYKCWKEKTSMSGCGCATALLYSDQSNAGSFKVICSCIFISKDGDRPQRSVRGLKSVNICSPVSSVSPVPSVKAGQWRLYHWALPWWVIAPFPFRLLIIAVDSWYPSRAEEVRPKIQPHSFHACYTGEDVTGNPGLPSDMVPCGSYHHFHMQLVSS